jgi:hypothetical protein
MSGEGNTFCCIPWHFSAVSAHQFFIHFSLNLSPSPCALLVKMKLDLWYNACSEGIHLPGGEVTCMKFVSALEL